MFQKTTNFASSKYINNMKKLITHLLMITALSFAIQGCHKTKMLPSGPKIVSNTRFMLEETASFSVINAGKSSPVEIDFGDGNNASGTVADQFLHKYMTAGDYKVTVKVSGEEIEKTVRVYNLLSLKALMPIVAAQDHDKIMVMSHRANSTDKSIPENSISAVEECIRLGVDIVEADTHLTLDGVVVICHDQTIDRTTNGTGDITQMTLEEIKSYRLLDREGNITTETMPTLEEYLKAARGRVYVNLDYSPRTAGTEAVFSVVRKLDMVQSVLLYCNSAAKVQECLSIDENAQVYPWATVYSPLVGKGIYFVQYNSNTSIGSAIKDGMVCTVNMASVAGGSESNLNGKAFILDESEVDTILDSFPFVRVLHTDTPEELIRYLNSKGLR